MTKRSTAPLLSALLLFALASSACTNYRVVRNGELNGSALRRIEERTAKTRELPFKEPVDAEVFTREESGEWFERHFAERDPERDRLDDVIGHRMGFLPDGVSLSKLFARAMKQNAAGVYRSREKRLYIVSDILPGAVRLPLFMMGYLTGTDWSNELVLSHELTHALQDQHFDLDKLVPGSLYGTNEDMALARKSVIESEANIVSQALILGVDLDSFVQRNAMIGYLALFSDLNVLVTRWTTPGLPAFYAKLFVEQYTQGMRFVASASNRGGLEGLNRAYRNELPRSSEQLLHPKRFFGPKFDEPIALVPISVPAALSGYQHIESNVFGELLFRIYLDDYTSRRRASRAAAGWGGDHYDLFEQTADARKERAVVLVWRTLWDSEDDAQQFAQEMQMAVSKKYAGRTTEREGSSFVVDVRPNKKGDRKGTVRTHHNEVAGVFVDGTGVLVVEGSPPEQFEALVRELWPTVMPDPEAPVVTKAQQLARTQSAESSAAFPRHQSEPQRSVLDHQTLLPHHEMAFRSGYGRAYFSERTTETGGVVEANAFTVVDQELRWGFRKNLEWAPPFIFSAGARTGRAFAVVTAGFTALDVVRSEDGFGVVAEPVFGVTTQFRLLDGVHLRFQSLGSAQFSTFGGDQKLLQVELNGALHLAPFEMWPANVMPISIARTWLWRTLAAKNDRLVVSLGVGRRARKSLGSDSVAGEFVFGAAGSRGLARVPTIELRVFDRLALYEASRLFWDSRTLAVVGHDHVGGVLVYF